MANKIQIKRGTGTVPTLAEGELGFSTDTIQLHIGDGTANHEVVMADLFDAQTVLAATADNTPAALSVGEQTLIGRLAGGNVAAIALGIADDNIVQMDDTDAATSDFAKFTAAGLEGRSYAEVMADLSGAAAAAFSMNGQRVSSGGDPTDAQDFATKAYADSIAAGFDPKGSVRVATTAALPDCTAAGTGVGKTLTASAAGVLTVDGVATVLGDRILVKDQATGSDNGIYEVTTEGTDTVAFVLTRATDFDEDAEVTGGAYCFITEGTENADEGWILTTNDPITVDTTTLTFSQFSSATFVDTFPELTDTPASYTGASLDVVRVNSGETGLEFVDFVTTYLEATPTDGVTNKAPNSDWAHDHDVATTGVHGASTNTLIHSGSTIDGGAFA